MPIPTSVQGHTLVGPFEYPARPVNGPGLYITVSPVSGDPVFSHWNGSRWGRYASNPSRAQELRTRLSSHQTPTWYGVAAPEAKR